MTSNDQEIRGFTAAEANQFREDLDLRLQQHPLSQAVRFTDNIEDCCATHRSIIATPARNDVLNDSARPSLRTLWLYLREKRSTHGPDSHAIGIQPTQSKIRILNLGC